MDLAHNVQPETTAGEIIELKKQNGFQYHDEELKPCDLNWHSVDSANEKHAKEKRVFELCSVDEINQMVRFFLDRDRVRDALIFIVQCNTGLRISDVLWLRWKDIFTDVNRIETQKTKTIVTFYPNQAVIEAANLYKTTMTRLYCPDDFIFVSEGPHTGHTPIQDRKTKRAPVRQHTVEVQPLRVETVSRMMTKAGKEAGLAINGRRISTHTGRKTHANALDNLVSGYELGEDLEGQAARIRLAQCALGHAKAETTVSHYLTDKLHAEACRRMNFGLEPIIEYKNRKGIV